MFNLINVTALDQFVEIRGDRISSRVPRIAAEFEKRMAVRVGI